MSFLRALFGKHDSPKNPALERAMHEVAKNDNAKTRESLYKTILASTFIVQGNVSGGTEARKGKLIADGDTQFSFRTVEHPAGNIILPVFTDIEGLTAFEGSEVPWVGLRAQQLFQLIAPGDIAEVRVNPFRTDQRITKPGGIITRSEFVALAQGLLPQSMAGNRRQLKVAAGQKIFCSGLPAKEPPAEFLKRLTDYFQQIPDLRGAYLFQITNQNVSSTVIGLHFDAKPNAQRMQQIMAGTDDIVKGAIPADEFIDFMTLESGPFLDRVQKSGKVLLKR